MSNSLMYYFVYRITNKVIGKHYYGYKSSKKHPKEVIGKTYFSSLKGKDGDEFRHDQKENPQHYKYKIIKIFDNKLDAISLEIKLHSRFDVKKNNKFYNNANQKSTGFGTNGCPGKHSAKDKFGNKLGLVSLDDPRWETGEIISTSKGRTHTEESKKKMSLAKLGKPMSSEAIEKNRIAQTGKKLSEEHKKNISIGVGSGEEAPRYNIPHTEETKNKISETKGHGWFLLSPDENVVYVKSLRKFAQENGLHRKNLTNGYRSKGWSVIKREKGAEAPDFDQITAYAEIS